MVGECWESERGILYRSRNNMRTFRISVAIISIVILLGILLTSCNTTATTTAAATATTTYANIAGTSTVSGIILYEYGYIMQLVLFAPDESGNYVFNVTDDTPQTYMDENGQFTFTGLKSNYYLLAKPLGNNMFQVFYPPSIPNLNIRTDGAHNFWMFEVKEGESVDLGSLSRIADYAPGDNNYIIVTPE
jgi:hypothetical protein